LFILLFLSLFQGSDELWTRALSQLDHSPKEAAASLEQWVSGAQKVGTQSPEAHYNLGIAYYESNEYAGAVAHFLKSIELRDFPFRGWQDLNTLTTIQKQIGIKDTVTDKIAVRFALLTSKNFLVTSTSIGFWCLCGFFLLLWRMKLAVYPLAFLGAFIWLITLFSYSNRAYQGLVATLDGHGKEIPLYKTIQGGDLQELLTLPSGTIVMLGEKQDHYYQVREPFSGWIDAENLYTMAETSAPLTETEYDKNLAYQIESNVVDLPDHKSNL
jgi:hypothetical protein